MRTTLTLEDDVAVLLERARRERKTSLKRLINDALRIGLTPRRPRRAPRYRIEPFHVGGCLFENLDDVAGVLAIAEGERYK
jgi:hypothetical protein